MKKILLVLLLALVSSIPLVSFGRSIDPGPRNLRYVNEVCPIESS